MDSVEEIKPDSSITGNPSLTWKPFLSLSTSLRQTSIITVQRRRVFPVTLPRGILPSHLGPLSVEVLAVHEKVAQFRAGRIKRELHSQTTVRVTKRLYAAELWHDILHAVSSPSAVVSSSFLSAQRSPAYGPWHVCTFKHRFLLGYCSQSYVTFSRFLM
jgi:hypothetical protein